MIIINSSQSTIEVIWITYKLYQELILAKSNGGKRITFHTDQETLILTNDGTKKFSRSRNGLYFCNIFKNQEHNGY